jgi:hypothetical protein
MAIDRADWHYLNEYPTDLDVKNASTHIGMYLTWIIINQLEGEFHHEMEDSILAIEKIKKREMTGADFLIELCDEKFWEEDLNSEGLLFTKYYYANEEGYGLYLDDYQNALAADVPSLYHVENSWENYDKISKIIDERYKDWKETN